MELDPFDFLNIAGTSSNYLLARRYDDAIAAFKKRIELDPSTRVSYTKLGEVYSGKGMYREAIAEYQLAINFSTRETPDIEALIGAAYVNAGERAKAEEMFQK